MGWPTLSRIPSGKLPISRVRLEFCANYASVAHTYLAHAPLAGVHTNFVRQMRARVPLGRPPPRFCDLQSLTTSLEPHETTATVVLPAAAWARINPPICVRELFRDTPAANHGLLQVTLVDVDPLEEESASRSPGITPHRWCSRSALILGDPKCELRVFTKKVAPLGQLGFTHLHREVRNCVLDGTSSIHP